MEFRPLQGDADVLTTRKYRHFFPSLRAKTIGYVTWRPLYEDCTFGGLWLGGTSLHYAALDGDIVKVTRLLLDGDNPNSKDEDWRRPLHYATVGGHSAVVDLLWQHGADLQSRDVDGRTSLYYAAKYDHRDVVDLLLRHGADPCTKDKNGRAPLHYAAEGGHNIVVELLLRHEANPCGRDKDGRTPLHFAAKGGHRDVVVLLLQYKAGPRIKDKNGRAPLHYAAEEGHSGVVALLLKRGANRCSEDADGHTPFYYAVRGGHRIVTALLTRQSAESCKKEKAHNFMEKPLPLITTRVDGRMFTIFEEAEKDLLNKDKPMSVVAIVGKCRTGKSYLMNRLYGKNSGFDMGSTVQSKTKVIWGRPIQGTVDGDANRKLHLNEELTEDIILQAYDSDDTETSRKYFPPFMCSIPDAIPELVIDILDILDIINIIDIIGGRTPIHYKYLEHSLHFKNENGGDTPLTECIQTFLPEIQCPVSQKAFEEDPLLLQQDQDKKTKAQRFSEASLCYFQEPANAINCSLETNMGMDQAAYQMFLMFLIWQGIIYQSTLKLNLFEGPIMITVYLPLCTILNFEVTCILLVIGGVELNPGPNTNQGYKVNLKDPDAELPSHLLCVKCNLLLRKPRQTVCGHRLCSGCLHEHVSGGPQKCVVHDCPDIIPSEDQVYPDRAVEREVLKLEVVCTNKEDGCPWEGKLKDYEAHEAECEFIRQLCRRSGCKDFVYRKDLERHLKEDCLMRPVDCEYCKAELVFKDVKDHHLSDCPEFPVECDQCHISKIFTRLQLKNHQDLVLGDCPVKLAQCPFASFGCTKKVKPEEIGSHLKDNLSEHVDLLFHKMDEVRRQQAEVNVQHQNGEADRQCGELDSKLQAVQRTLTDLDKIIRAEGGQEPRPTPGQSREVNEVRAMMDERERKLQRCEETIIDLARKLEVLFQQIDFYERERQKNQELMQAGANKITMLERSLASKDDTLQLNDTRVENLERATYNGILVWKITDFGRRRQDAVNNRVPSFYSPPFYTSKSGYKMCARIYLNGDGMGKGSHISLFFVICKGSNDALLRWPFRQKVTLMLLDQNNKEHIIDAFRPDPSSSSFKKPTNEMNIASGCPMFATLSQLDSPSHAYIKDDTVFFKIIVDCADLQ